MPSSAVHEEHDEVLRLILAGFAAQVVSALANLSIAEQLDNGPLTAKQIAAHISADADMIYRLLRAGVALGLLNYDRATEAFAPTPRLAILHQDSAFTLKHFAQTVASPAFWHTSQRLADSVRRGRNYVEETLGADLWGYFAQHNDQAWMFRSAMTDISAPVVREAVAAIDAGTGFVVDVGGASGTFVGELVQRNPRLTGAVFDLPQAMPGVAEHAERLGISDRMSGIAGDFFESVPAGDYYLLKFILHDWSDESCIKILSNIRRAMKPDARLFVVEMVIPERDIPTAAAMLDMVMLFSLTGQERELAEYEKLFTAADLKMAKTTVLHRPYQLIEARPR